jgi:hypothetical protein
VQCSGGGKIRATVTALPPTEPSVERLLSAQCSVLCAQCSVLSAQCSVLSTQCSVLSAQYSVLSTQCSVLSAQWSVLPRSRCHRLNLLAGRLAGWLAAYACVHKCRGAQCAQHTPWPATRHRAGPSRASGPPAILLQLRRRPHIFYSVRSATEGALECISIFSLLHQIFCRHFMAKWNAVQCSTALYMII